MSGEAVIQYFIELGAIAFGAGATFWLLDAAWAGFKRWKAGRSC